MYVGHSALRRYVMGDACYERASNDAERDQIVALTEEAMRAGAMGWSSSKAPVHLDLADRPVPSRLAGTDELLGMADAVGRAGGLGSIAYAPESAMEGIDAADRDLMIDLARRGGVPVITQGLGGRSKTDAPELAWQEASDFLDRSAVGRLPGVLPADGQRHCRTVHHGAGHDPLRGGPALGRAVPPARRRAPPPAGATRTVGPPSARPSTTRTGTRPRARPFPRRTGRPWSCSRR